VKLSLPNRISNRTILSNLPHHFFSDWDNVLKLTFLVFKTEKLKEEQRIERSGRVDKALLACNVISRTTGVKLKQTFGICFNQIYFF